MSYDTILDLENITLQDCESMLTKGLHVVINDGHVVNFESEENER